MIPTSVIKSAPPTVTKLPKRPGSMPPFALFSQVGFLYDDGFWVHSYKHCNECFICTSKIMKIFVQKVVLYAMAKIWTYFLHFCNNVAQQEMADETCKIFLKRSESESGRGFIFYLCFHVFSLTIYLPTIYTNSFIYLSRK